jgi:hypothetical protein
MPRHVGRSLSGSYLPGLLRPLRLCLPRSHPPNGSIGPFLVTRNAGPALSLMLVVSFHLLVDGGRTFAPDPSPADHDRGMLACAIRC